MEKRKPTIYTVATAHLDTVWNWDFETTVKKYIKKTLEQNFEWFETYPEYKFSFEGSYRYELMEEYYPELFEKLKEYVAAGRWAVAGSAYENGDVNVPSPEALIRNIFYGKEYFRETFGKESADIYLPDCFGFGLALPSIAKACGLLGFTTQKLTWSSAYGIPFDLGIWAGVDGSEIYASLDAQSYSDCLKEVRTHKNASAKLRDNIRRYELPYTYLLHGVGDRGGAPRKKSVETVVRENRLNSTSEWDVVIESTDQIFKDLDQNLTDKQKKLLPRWEKELVSTNHGVGGYTSRTAGKRLNRHCEQLADAAERSLTAAAYLTDTVYPQKELDTAWKRFIAHQFHDDLPGTSLERCYPRSWNDYAVSLRQLEEEYRTGISSLSALFDTSHIKGIPVIVYNPVQAEDKRRGIVEAEIPEWKNASSIRVLNGQGEEAPSQIIRKENGRLKVIFQAAAASVGYALYDICPAEEPYRTEELKVTERSLENEYFVVTLDDNGDISSIFDKRLSEELLASPVRMGLHAYNGSRDWPAWELTYDEVMAEPEEYAAMPKFRIRESGGARIAVETVRTARGSVFTQVISLEKGGDVVRVDNDILWNSKRTLLKTPFSFNVSSSHATYDLGLGMIQRGVNTKQLYEVPAQSFADISGERYGVSVLSDSKYGWDMPDTSTLRLTGIHTPKWDYRRDSRQSEMDLGRNRYGFGIFSHENEVGRQTQLAGLYFNQPMCAVVLEGPKADTVKNKEVSGRTEYSFADIDNQSVLIRAIKKAAHSEEIIVRFNEGTGKEQKAVTFGMAGGIRAAREVYATEEPLGEAAVKEGRLVFDMGAYQVKTFALTLEPCKEKTEKEKQQQLSLTYQITAVSDNGNSRSGPLKGRTIPAELFPEKINSGGICFWTSQGEQQALACDGQKLSLPAGTKNLHLLMTSADGDREICFRVGGKLVQHRIADCMEPIGSFGREQEGKRIKACVPACCFTHMHRDEGEDIAKQCCLFKLSVEILDGAESIQLPDDPAVLLFAATAEFEGVRGRMSRDILEEE